MRHVTLGKNAMRSHTMITYDSDVLMLEKKM